MTKRNKRKTSSGNSKKSFLERLPSKVPFVPIIRRPDFQLRKIRMRAPRKISATFIIVLMLLGVFYILIGGFYYSSQDENYAVVPHPDTGEPSVIWLYGYEDQTIFEGVAVGILIYIGAGGFYLVHKASHYAYSPATVTKYLCIGIGLALLTMLAVTVLFFYKMEILKEWLDELRAAYGS